MHINYTFKVNAFSVEKGVISVTYLPVDLSLELKPKHHTQLGIDKQIMIDYSTGVITSDEFKSLVRKAIVDADGQPQHEWNETLAARTLTVPPEVEGMLGFEWPTVTEAESSNISPEVM